MKINNNNYQNYLKAIQQTKQHKPANNTKAGNKDQNSKANNKDQVNISADAKRLAEISKQEQRDAKVEGIKTAIQDGTYEVKPKEIANALIDTMRAQKGEE